MSCCGGTSQWFRLMVRCPFCRRRRRMLRRTVFHGYGSDIICGGCGARNSDLDGFYRPGKRDSRANVEKVRSEWAAARPASAFRGHLEELLRDAGLGDGR